MMAPGGNDGAGWGRRRRVGMMAPGRILRPDGATNAILQHRCFPRTRGAAPAGTRTSLRRNSLMHLPPEARRRRALDIAQGLPRAFWVLWFGMLVNRAGNFVLPFLAIYLTQARGLSPAQAGIVLALYGAGAAVASPLGGYLADHAGRRATLVG